MLAERIGVGVIRIVDTVVQRVDDLIAGDGGARVQLTPQQLETMRRWHQVERPVIIKKRIDVSWGSPH